MVLDVVGAGLIAGGGLILLATFLGGDPGESFASIERDRRERNAWLSSRASAVATAAGAVLLLIPSSQWWWSLGVAVLTLVACYLVLAQKTHSEYTRVRSHVRAQVGESLPVSLHIATLLGLMAESIGTDDLSMMMARSAFSDSEAALAVAEERASWRWALRHPTGARGQGM